MLPRLFRGLLERLQPYRRIEPRPGLLLHISDTPSTTFRALKRIIRAIQPAWIVHTGDLVDEVKLELHPHCIEDYTPRVRKLLAILEDSRAGVFLVMGNHDNAATVRHLARRSTILTEPADLLLGGRRLRVAHYSEDILGREGEFNLYGHSDDLPSRVYTDRVLLNGLEHIHVIDTDSGHISYLSYPVGTDDQRMLKRSFRF
ncbi:MAG: metallophosphoesterase [Synergistales bacterium]|nr:metallophosphoesterase [Synergistales bacterium]